MLVLTRKSREAVVVGEADGLRPMLTVTVIDIRGGNVKLGFEADARVPVHREEVWERINGNGQAGRPTEGPATPLT